MGNVFYELIWIMNISRTTSTVIIFIKKFIITTTTTFRSGGDGGRGMEKGSNSLFSLVFEGSFCFKNTLIESNFNKLVISSIPEKQ